jgi:NhaP-type Na+/H+ or K+/H+ antiporter
MLEVGLVAGALLVYALVAGRLRTTALTGAIFFAGLGLLAGDRGLDIVTTEETGEWVTLVLEVTLAVVLFTDAAATSSSALVRERSVALRLLGVGLPLSVVAGWAIALALLPELSLWEAALVGAILAPTDAALGEAVVSNPRVPALVRDELSIESGLNDGLALPFVTLFVALALATNGQESEVQPAEAFLRAIVLSGALGIAIAWIAARLLLWSQDRGWGAPSWQSIALLGVTVLAYLSADAAQGSGFIAVWAAGATTGTIARDRLAGVGEFPSKLSELLTSVSYLLFGALFLGRAIENATWTGLGYALLSLTAVRMLPVLLSLLGTGFSRPTTAYIGWFGPRGLASLIFAGIVVENELPGAVQVVNVVMLTVGLSILLHGITAWWGAERYADWFDRASKARPDLPEGGTSPPVARRRGVGWARGGGKA